MIVGVALYLVVLQSVSFSGALGLLSPRLHACRYQSPQLQLKNMARTDEDRVGWEGPRLGPEETLQAMIAAVREAGDAALMLQVRSPGLVFSRYTCE